MQKKKKNIQLIKKDRIIIAMVREAVMNKVIITKVIQYKLFHRRIKEQKDNNISSKKRNLSSINSLKISLIIFKVVINNMEISMAIIKLLQYHLK